MKDYDEDSYKSYNKIIEENLNSDNFGNKMYTIIDKMQSVKWDGKIISKKFSNLGVLNKTDLELIFKKLSSKYKTQCLDYIEMIEGIELLA